MPDAFTALGLIEPLAAAVRAEGYTVPTPIRIQAIPHVLAGKDLLGLAQTGTGKTAAFALPVLQRLHEQGYRPRGERPIRALVLTPTRELAAQIGDSFASYGKNLGYTHAVIYGGVGASAQQRALRAGVDVLVATPGRLLDLAGQRFVRLSHLDVFVLDEADRMLDMGFIPDVRRVIALLPPVRQTLFFSATMPPDAQRLADMLLKDPVTVSVAPRSATAERIDQSVYFVDKNDKRALLVDVLRDGAMTRVLCFTRTKHGANRVAEHLRRAGVRADAIHGNKSQNARERALAGFKEGSVRVLVATDIAARGIDIEEISHVVNFDVPNVPETYVHRIGRTARAGAAGTALSFCDAEERAYLRDIERLTRQSIRVAEDRLGPAAASPATRPPPDRRDAGGGRARRGPPSHARGAGPRRGPPGSTRPAPSRGAGPARAAPSRTQAVLAWAKERSATDRSRAPASGPAETRPAAPAGGRRPRRGGSRGRLP